MFKTSLVVGGAFAAGSYGGKKIAEALKVPATNHAANLGIQVATGFVAFFVLSSVLR